MKRLLTFVFICSAFTAQSVTYKITYEMFGHYFSMGYGLIALDRISVREGWGPVHYFEGVSGPIYAKYEYGLKKNFSVGVNAAYMTHHLSFSGNDRNGFNGLTVEDLKSYSILLRCNWHPKPREKLDYYYGVGIGYRYYEWKQTQTTSISRKDKKSSTYNPDGAYKDELPIGLEATIGIKYMLSDHLGFYGEFGAAKSLLQGGLVCKF